MEIFIDDQQCRGHGVCTTVCPDVFVINADGFAEVVASEVPTVLEDAVREAIESCPEQAINERIA